MGILAIRRGPVSTKSLTAVATTLVRQNTAGATTGVNTLKITLPSVNASHGLVLNVANYSGNTSVVASISDSSNNTWVKAQSVAFVSGVTGALDVWYVKNAIASSSTLTVTMTFTSGQFPAIAANISEWSRQLTYNTGASSRAANAATTATATTSATVGNLIIAALTTQNDDSPSVTAPATALTAMTQAGTLSIDPGYIIATSTSASVGWGTFSSTEQYAWVASAFTPS
jgi:Tfp pilus assembly major pilin PilA